MNPIHRHKTAIRRYDFSQSFKALERHGFLDGNYTIFDYGCGLGDDLRELEERGTSAGGWDPVYRKDAPINTADIVNLGFVLNVIENPLERIETLKKALELSLYVLSVSVMLGSEGIQGKFQTFGDGCLTSRNTFQKYFSQSEIRDYLLKNSGLEPVAMGPGVFFLFPNWEDREVFLLQRQMEKRSSESDHILKLDDTPHSEEIESTDNKPSKNPFKTNKWETNREHLFRKKNDLLVYLALWIFQGMDKKDLPESISNEIRGLFLSLAQAKKESTNLLYSIADTNLIETLSLEFNNTHEMGLIEEGHSYTIHSSYLDKMHPTIRVYVGIALHLFGDRELVDLIKIHFTSGKVTFLHYNDFENSPEPMLHLRVKVNLRNQKIDFFEYGEEFPSQPLMEKERFLPIL
jgi:hypothetical protein